MPRCCGQPDWRLSQRCGGSVPQRCRSNVVVADNAAAARTRHATDIGLPWSVPPRRRQMPSDASEPRATALPRHRHPSARRPARTRARSQPLVPARPHRRTRRLDRRAAEPDAATATGHRVPAVGAMRRARLRDAAITAFRWAAMHCIAMNCIGKYLTTQWRKLAQKSLCRVAHHAVPPTKKARASRPFECASNDRRDQNGISSSAKSSIGGADCCWAGC